MRPLRWATIFGHDQLARLFDPTADPLHVALLGAHICTEMAESIFLGKQDVMDRATRWRCGRRTRCRWRLTSAAYVVLQGRMSTNADKSLPLLDLALMTKMKTFLAHRHAVSMADQRWRGKTDKQSPLLAEQFNWALVTLYICLPFVNPYILYGTLPDTTAPTKPKSGSARARCSRIVLNASKNEQSKVLKGAGGVVGQAGKMASKVGAAASAAIDQAGKRLHIVKEVRRALQTFQDEEDDALDLVEGGGRCSCGCAPSTTCPPSSSAAARDAPDADGPPLHVDRQHGPPARLRRRRGLV